MTGTRGDKITPHGCKIYQIIIIIRLDNNSNNLITKSHGCTTEGSSILECMSVMNDSPSLKGTSVLGGSSIFEDMPVLYLSPISSLLNSILLLDAGSLSMVSSPIYLKGTILSFSMLVSLHI